MSTWGMQFPFTMQVNHNSWMCRSLQTDRDKLPMIREWAAEREQTLSNVHCACASCVKFYYIMIFIWCDAKSQIQIQMRTWFHSLFCPIALALWIISSLMMAIKNLYVHTNHLTDQPSVDCMHFVLLSSTAECILNAKPTGYTVAASVCVCLCATFSDNSKRQFEDNVMSSRLLIISNWIAHLRQINNWSLPLCDENAYARSPLFSRLNAVDVCVSVFEYVVHHYVEH